MRTRIRGIYFLAFIFSFTLFLFSCSGGGGGGDGGGGVPSTPPVIRYDLADDTIIVEESNLQPITSEGGTYIYTSQAPPPLEPGDILLSTDGNDGFGYLRKVTSVTMEGSTVTVNTEQATLEEAFDELEIHWSQQLTQNDIYQFQPLRKGVYLKKSMEKSPLQVESPEITIQVGTTIPDDYGNIIQISGEIVFKIKINFDLDLLPAYVRFVPEIEEHSSLNVSGHLTLQGSKKVELSRLYFGAFQLGPVTLVPCLTVSVGLDGEVDISVSFGVTQQANFSAGLKYENGNWSPVSNYNNDFQIQPPQWNIEANLKAFADANLNLLIYGVTGPYLGAELYSRLESTLSPYFSSGIYGGLGINAGVKLDIWKIFHIECEMDIASWEIPLFVCQDQDNDSYAYGEGVFYRERFCGSLQDCDDLNASINPGATELCDGVDNNCDGQIDEGCGGETVQEVSGGMFHTCALLSSGAVKCWGDNYLGQLGDGSWTDSSVPVDVIGITDAIGISAGDYHTCAVLSSGAVNCWGYNAWGQLGDGSISDAISISAGAGHTCALLSSGAVKCWGANEVGQLGDGSTVDSSVPVDVVGISDAISIFAGRYHTCAVLSSRTVKCWGDNGFYQLGDGSYNGYSLVPVEVVGISNAISISAGENHTCALLSSGAVKCWGDNRAGQLGDGSTVDSNVPVDVVGITDAISISAGHWHTCALLSSGAVKCWGANWAGQLGDGSNTDSLVPVDVVGITDAISISAGYYHTCALLSSRAVKCWGKNGNGQLGDGSNNDSNVPVDVVGIGP